MSKTVMAIVAHADDEALGCAGTLARHSQRGDSVHLLILADGESAREGEVADNRLQAREAMASRAAEALGITEVSFGQLPDNRLDSLPLLEITQLVESHARRLQPQIIYTHHAGDLNIDHRLTHEAVLTAFRPQPSCSVEKILCFETASSTEWRSPGHAPAFEPHIFIDISETWPRKQQALAHYGEEMRPYPHARSIEAVEALARWRGASAGLPMAEAFVLARELIR